MEEEGNLEKGIDLNRERKGGKGIEGRDYKSPKHNIRESERVAKARMKEKKGEKKIKDFILIIVKNRHSMCILNLK